MPTHAAPEVRRIWIVGSAVDCDIVVGYHGVSSRHCRLVEYENGFALEDLGSTNGTIVNGRRLTPGTAEWVNKSDVITLGQVQALPWPAARTTVAQAGVWRRQVLIGRAPECEQVLDYPMISWHHARLLEDQTGQLFVEDLDSANGTAIGSVAARIPPHNPTPVRPQDELFLGSYKVPVQRLAGARRMTIGAASGGQVAIRGNRMVLGRDPSCDYPLDYPMISWRHAEVTREGSGIFVTDLGSRNGTYVDGTRISGKTALRPGSEIGLGSYRFTLLDSGDFARREYNGNVTIESVALTVDISRNGQAHRLLMPVSLTIFPSEMVAVMGPAGAGKTTFLKALNGYTAPSYGRVLFNGADLYQYYDRFRLQLGYVPQDDIMHPLLTVEEALFFTAKLRTDLTGQEIRKRVVQVLTDLGIEDIAGRQIGSPEMKVISGGQRKRVNIAMELLSDPNVLFLDEPTSGLSSYDALQVVRLLRRLADSGKTVVLTIHQPSLDIYKEFDNLIMMSRDKGSASSGAMAYFGPAFPDSIHFFNPRQPDEDLSPELLLEGLSKRSTPEWVQSYAASDYKRKFVDDRAGQMPSTAAQGKGGTVRAFGFGQWLTLVHRNVLLKLRDKGQTLFMLMQSTLFPILMVIVFKYLDVLVSYGSGTDWVDYTGKVTTVHFLLVVAAIWFGCNNAARDIVGEWAIFQRERMVSLKLPSYLFSKIAVLAVISMVQCLLLLGIVQPACNLQAPFLQLYLTLFLASQAGAALGLLISSFSSTTESAIAFLPIPLLFMILLGGGIKPLHGMGSPGEELAMAFPARWAFEANILLENKARWPAKENPDNSQDLAETVFPRVYEGKTLVRHSYTTCLAWLSGMWVVFSGSVLIILRRRDIL